MKTCAHGRWCKTQSFGPNRNRQRAHTRTPQTQTYQRLFSHCVPLETPSSLSFWPTSMCDLRRAAWFMLLKPGRCWCCVCVIAARIPVRGPVGAPADACPAQHRATTTPRTFIAFREPSIFSTVAVICCASRRGTEHANCSTKSGV